MCNWIEPCACSISDIGKSVLWDRLLCHAVKFYRIVRSLLCCLFLRLYCFREAPAGRLGSVSSQWLEPRLRAEIKWKHSRDFVLRKLSRKPQATTSQCSFITKRSDVSYVTTCSLWAVYSVQRNYSLGRRKLPPGQVIHKRWGQISLSFHVLTAEYKFSTDSLKICLSYLLGIVERHKLLLKFNVRLEYSREVWFLRTALVMREIIFPEKSHAWLSKWREVRLRVFFSKTTLRGPQRRKTGLGLSDFENFSSPEQRVIFLFLYCFNSFNDISSCQLT